MPSRLFKEEQLRLYVVAALTSGTVTVAEAVLLPPKPLSLSASWNCQTGVDNDWLCRSPSRTSFTRTHRTPTPVPERIPDPVRQTVALPVYRPESSEIFPVREVPAGLPSSDVSESAVLMELLNSPENYYVLQWQAANQRGPLENLKKRYPVLQHATIAQYQRTGKHWYVLLDGPFANRGEAMAALESPPRSHMARELYPWTRSIASIQRLDLRRPDSPSSGQLAREYDQQGYNSNTLAYEIPASLPEPGYGSYNSTVIPAYESYQNSSQASIQPQVYGQRLPEQQLADYSQSLIPQEVPAMYASISEAYSSTIPEQHPQQEARGNYYEFPRDKEKFLQKEQQDYNQQKAEPEPYRWSESDNVLKASPHSYTIVWMTSSRKPSLERAQRRYKEFQDTQILYYRQFNRDRFVLVSKIFGNRNAAVTALSRPSLANLSSRFAPKVQKIGDLKQLTERFHQQIPRTAQTSQLHLRQSPVRRYQQPARNVRPEAATGKVQRYSRVASRVKPPQTAIAQKSYSRPSSDHSSNRAKYLSQKNSKAVAVHNGYTIQWFAANNPGAIEKMKKRFPELASARTVHYRKNQKDWYVLVQGKYRNSQEAIAAIKSPELKQAMLVLHPWTRPVNSLKNLGIVSL